MNAIVAEALGKRYHEQTALADVSFSLPQGTLLALLGHNGAGKTTLMKLMLGLIHPTSGSVRVLGQMPSAAALAFRRQLGFLPENVAFHDELNGRDTLRYFARLKGERPAVCDDLLERVGLSFAAGRRVKTYSKGMRQRLGLAQALLGKPRILLLDEPTTGLDPVLRREVFAILGELTRNGATVVLSSHILTELDARTELVAIMRRGRLAAWGTLPALCGNAGMPIRIRLAAPGGPASLAPHLNGFPVSAVDGRTVELTCSQQDKMAVLRHVAALGALVEDVEMRLPGLDDVYLHYGQGDDPE